MNIVYPRRCDKRLALRARRLSMPRLVIGMAMWACVAPLPAVAMQADYNRLASLEVPGLAWEAGQSMYLSGVPAYMRPFSSLQAPAAVAEALSAKAGVFQRVLVARRKVLLSGLNEGWHWLAHIEAAPSGAQGYVSMLGLAPGSGGPEPLPAWLPPGSAPAFGHTSGPHGGTVVQHVYRIPLDSRQLSTYLRKQLRAEGWVPEPALASAQTPAEWRRGGSSLKLVVAAAETGTALYVQHKE